VSGLGEGWTTPGGGCLWTTWRRNDSVPPEGHNAGQQILSTHAADLIRIDPTWVYTHALDNVLALLTSTGKLHLLVTDSATWYENISTERTYTGQHCVKLDYSALAATGGAQITPPPLQPSYLEVYRSNVANCASATKGPSSASTIAAVGHLTITVPLTTYVPS
jgi:hypothetical protein